MQRDPNLNEINETYTIQPPNGIEMRSDTSAFISRKPDEDNVGLFRKAGTNIPEFLAQLLHNYHALSALRAYNQQLIDGKKIRWSPDGG